MPSVSFSDYWHYLVNNNYAINYTTSEVKVKLKNSMNGELVYTEAQVAALLRIAGLDENEISDLFEYVCFCDIPGCKEVAEYEGWIGNGLIRKVNVCEGHKHLLRGYKDEKN